MEVKYGKCKVFLGIGGDSSRVQGELKGVVAIGSTGSAFAAVRSDGSVVTWGSEGPKIDTIQNNQTNKHKTKIKQTHTKHKYLFCFWVHCHHLLVLGGDSSRVAGELRKVVAIRGTLGAFAALRIDGSVVSWGSSGVCVCVCVCVSTYASNCSNLSNYK